VTSTPPGIACAPTCEASYADGTLVTLTPHTAANAVFTGWSGACTGTGTCIVPMTKSQAVTAIFTLLSPNQFALMVDLTSGTDGGTVTSTPPGIDCGTTCSAPYDAGTRVTLGATANANAVFTGWEGGGCSGTDPCSVTMTRNTTVKATFT